MKVKTTFLYQNKFTKTPDETQEKGFYNSVTGNDLRILCLC